MEYKVYFTATDKGYVTVTAKNIDQAYERAKEKFQDGRFVEYTYSKWEVTDYVEENDED